MDLESVYNSIIEIIKEKINGKLAEINAEKADDVQLPAIPMEAIYETLEQKVIEFDPFILIEINRAEGRGRAVDCEVAILICFSAQSNSKNNKHLNLRYSRAVQEVMLDASEDDTRLRFCDDKTVSQVSYGARMQDQQQLKVAGAEFSFTIGY